MLVALYFGPARLPLLMCDQVEKRETHPFRKFASRLSFSLHLPYYMMRPRKPYEEVSMTLRDAIEQFRDHQKTSAKEKTRES